MFGKLTTLMACGALVAGTMLVGVGSASAASPIGHLDAVNYDSKYNSISANGWAGDPDVGTAPIRVHLYVDGVGAQSVGTGLTRTDVAAVHPSLGTHTGFYGYFVQPPGRGTHTVCAYAINVAAGGNVLIGCKTVVVDWPFGLLGHIDHIGVDPADPSMRIASGWALDPADAQSPTPFDLVRASGPTTAFVWDYLMDQAGAPRPDVDHAYPRNGHNHGFAAHFRASDVDWAATDTICLAQAYWVPGWVGSPTPYCITYAG